MLYTIYIIYYIYDIIYYQDQSKGAVPSNYRPITCLPTMWKLFSGVLADKIEHYIGELMSDSQKGVGRGTRGAKHQLVIDKTVTGDSKRRSTNLAMYTKHFLDSKLCTFHAVHRAFRYFTIRAIVGLSEKKRYILHAVYIEILATSR